MRLERLPKEFQEALPVIKRIQEAGYEAYFVGGSVRDFMLQQPIHDVDIATSAFPEEIQQLFPKTFDVGIQHGTVMVLADNQITYEITTFRTESTYQDYRRPDQVAFVRSLAEDLKRRDFTINALALKSDGSVVDLFDGLADLAAKVIRAVGDPHERLREDALRMMRGLRFVSQLGFELEAETMAAILENHRLLAKISVERIHVEFVKLMLGRHRQAALQAFVSTECYQYCPGLRTAGETLLRLAELPQQPLANEAQAWSLLLYLLRLQGTEIVGFLKAWKASNHLTKEVQQIVSSLTERLRGPWTAMQLYHAGAVVIQQTEALRPYFGQPDENLTALTAYQALPIHNLQELALSGSDLLALFQRKGGRWVSQLLACCESAVVTGEVLNERAVLTAFAKEHYARVEQS